MNRFVTLMRREWLQHRSGWLMLMVLPLALMLLLSLVDGHGVHVTVNDDDNTLPPLRQLPVVLQTLGWTLATAGITFVLAGLSVIVQLPGLARRDIQDRSIEFWRSLPTGHSESVGATLLMHLLVLPLAAVTVATLGAQLVALVAIVSTQGPLAWLQQPWWLLLPAMATALARLALGLLLAVLWLSPVLLLTMAASAWLKRWALPVVLGSLLVGVQVLDRRLPVPLVKPALDRMGGEAAAALFSRQSFAGLHFEGPADALQALPQLPGLLLVDAGRALVHAASPAFALALAGGALGFGLMVWRRQVSD